MVYKVLTPRFELGLTALFSQPSYLYEEPLPPLPVDIISRRRYTIPCHANIFILFQRTFRGYERIRTSTPSLGIPFYKYWLYRFVYISQNAKKITFDAFGGNLTCILGSYQCSNLFSRRNPLTLFFAKVLHSWFPQLPPIILTCNTAFLLAISSVSVEAMLPLLQPSWSSDFISKHPTFHYRVVGTNFSWLY